MERPLISTVTDSLSSSSSSSSSSSPSYSSSSSSMSKRSEGSARPGSSWRPWPGGPGGGRCGGGGSCSWACGARAPCAAGADAVRLLLIARQRSSGKRQRVARRRDVVNAEDARAALVGKHVGGDRARQASIDGQRLLAPARRRADRADEGLARNADQQRAPERRKLIKARQQREVVGDRLAEADPRVEHDPPLGDPRCKRKLEALGQKALDLRDNVAIAGVALHRARAPAHVHQAAFRAALRDAG